jgi:hypothetical protein
MFKKLLEMIKKFFIDIWERIEDFFGGLWDEIVEWFQTPWTKFKKWFKETALPWIIKGWMQVVNIIVLFVAYGIIDKVTQPGASTVVGLWLFLLAGYYIFWKLFGFDKVWKKRREKRKAKK